VAREEERLRAKEVGHAGGGSGATGRGRETASAAVLLLIEILRGPS